ncbi:MAG TPA: hypothetical protein P5565_14985 [Bacteroidia bacterium]|nr:hypothetical protein [Bacteroidia bacterium]
MIDRRIGTDDEVLLSGASANVRSRFHPAHERGQPDTMVIALIVWVARVSGACIVRRGVGPVLC